MPRNLVGALVRNPRTVVDSTLRLRSSTGCPNSQSDIPTSPWCTDLRSYGNRPLSRPRRHPVVFLSNGGTRSGRQTIVAVIGLSLLASLEVRCRATGSVEPGRPPRGDPIRVWNTMSESDLGTALIPSWFRGPGRPAIDEIVATTWDSLRPIARNLTTTTEIGWSTQPETSCLPFMPPDCSEPGCRGWRSDRVSG